MNNHFFEISDEEIAYFKRLIEEFEIQTKESIIHKGHIPIASYLLLKGRIDLKQSKQKVIHQLESNCLVGLRQIIENKKCRYTFDIHPGSKVLILDRSIINSIIESARLETLPNHFSLHSLLV